MLPLPCGTSLVVHASCSAACRDRSIKVAVAFGGLVLTDRACLCPALLTATSKRPNCLTFHQDKARLHHHGNVDDERASARFLDSETKALPLSPCLPETTMRLLTRESQSRGRPMPVQPPVMRTADRQLIFSWLDCYSKRFRCRHGTRYRACSQHPHQRCVRFLCHLLMRP